MTSCNSQKEVRLHGKKPPVGQMVSKHIVITLEISQEGQFSKKTYDQVNWL